MVLVRGADVSHEALEIEREQRRAAEGGVDITRDGVQRAIEAAKRTAPPPQDPLLGEMRRLGRSTGSATTSIEDSAEELGRGVPAHCSRPVRAA